MKMKKLFRRKPRVKDVYYIVAKDGRAKPIKAEMLTENGRKQPAVGEIVILPNGDRLAMWHQDSPRPHRLADVTLDPLSYKAGDVATLEGSYLPTLIRRALHTKQELNKRDLIFIAGAVTSSILSLITLVLVTQMM